MLSKNNRTQFAHGFIIPFFLFGRPRGRLITIELAKFFFSILLLCKNLFFEQVFSVSSPGRQLAALFDKIAVARMKKNLKEENEKVNFCFYFITVAITKA